MSDAALAPDAAEAAADATAAIGFVLNGRPVSAAVSPGMRLSEALRQHLATRDVKVGCNAGDCGACTVLLDGAAVCACLVATRQVEGKRVDTLAGLLDTPEGHRLADAFARHGAAQCGICTPGMMVAAVPLLAADPAPSEAAVKDALGGVLCRCTGYRKIIAAVMDAAGPAADAPAEADGVGARIPRIDGHAKIHGTERFGDDVAPADALVVRVVRSPHPRAAFTFGDLDDYAARHGVTVLTAADIPGVNRFGVIPPFADQPVFAEREARFRGEAVAAVVGEADTIAALDAFPVSFTPLPAVTDPAAAQAEDAPRLHESRPGNVMCRGLVRRGDADAALARADVVAEGRFRSPFVEHAYIEPEAGYAVCVGDRVEVYASTQAPVMDLEGLAPILGLPVEKVRIVPTAVGGGFGSKLDLSVQPYIALGAMKTGRPVRLAYSRTESMQSSTKRHPSDIVARIGATRDGRICGFHFEGDFDTGAYASWGPTVANRVPVHASGPYRVDDYLAKSAGIHTHNPPSGAFRGFGVPQSAIAQEVLFEDLAEALGIDPLEFRRRNALENGVPTVCGQIFEQGVGIGACFDALAPHFARARAEAEAFNAAARAAGSPLRRGAGLAAGWYGCGNTSMANPSTIRSGVTPEGRIVLHQGAMDIGQGANTVITQIFAAALGVPVAAVALVGPDTDVTPDAGKTSASRQTLISGNAARLSGAALRAMILRQANAGDDARIEPTAAGLVIHDGAASRPLDLAALPVDRLGYTLSAEESWDPPTAPMDENGQGVPYAVFGYAAHLCELTVDTALGTVRLEKFTAAHDVGKAINPLLVEGQVEGGIAQGAGMALMEAYIPGQTEDLHNYLIPTIGDMPPVETLIIEEPDAHGPHGAKGLGEHCLIPTAPAILNAIRHASGARLTTVPATPSAVRAAIRAAEEAQ
ncbi:molybdopterin-dependent oxidoreductase [Acuticoccus mangrovi]|uniref:Molybdopterin-dependent oxidoreductase n=1 Tax=Acuticoccus mangrovi TaxID=2796142 RepID=A0A934MK83_9HYPH|nr:molybdopterin cofactor-binding domain-containing protein [Acuticoccus mangrovi]MBJ3775244.1 molybdopterin-dependent oxidoreductase [Acuticoccus mangrovi]